MKESERKTKHLDVRSFQNAKITTELSVPPNDENSPSVFRTFFIHLHSRERDMSGEN